MTALPFTPATAGETILASYLQADPSRLPVVHNLMGLLDDDGSVGDTARYYIVRSGFRRAVLRGTLIALAFPLPSWAKETPAAAAANGQFVAEYRTRYNEHRRRQRSADPACPALHDQKSSN